MSIPLIGFLGWSGWVAALAFLAFGVLALWVWQKNKSNANLLTLIGAGALGLMFFFMGIKVNLGDFFGILLAGGSVVLLIGYYLTVKPMVAEQMASLKAKMESLKDAGDDAKDAGGGDA